ncbi:MAG: nucleotidyltransferase family protein [Holophagales bacterium]|nr:nucleotidyltransferase family protein [Holophagales bacterium]
MSSLGPFGLSPALELVRLGARFELGPAGRHEVARLVAGGLDWAEVVRLARWRRLAPLLGRHLASVRGVPAQPLRVLEQDRESTFERYRAMSWELGKILLAARSVGLPIVVLKGAALAERLYPDPSLRPMADLDLLVPEAELGRAEQLVAELGYRCTKAPETRRFQAHHHRHLAERRERHGRARLELHRHVVRPSSVLSFDIDLFWSRSVETALAGEPALVLCPADQALHLVLNLFQDTRQRYPSAGALGKLMELQALLARFGADDLATFERAVRSTHLSRVVSWILWAGERLTGTPLPPPLAQVLGEPRTSFRGFERFFRTKWLRPPGRPWYFHELVEPPDRPTTRALLRSAARRLLPPRQRLAVDYGPGPLPLLLWRHTRAAAGGVARLLLFPADSARSSKVDLFLGSLMGDGR